MSPFHSFPILILISIPSVFPISNPSADCSGFFSPEARCNQLTLDVIREWTKIAPLSDPDAASMLTSDCVDAESCYKRLECPEKNKDTSQKIADLSELCSGMWAFGGPLGRCFRDIRDGKVSREDYPCVKHWDNPSRTPSCEFFTSDYDCAQMLVVNQCEAMAMDFFKMNKKFILEYFGCSKDGKPSR